MKDLIEYYEKEQKNLEEGLTSLRKDILDIVLRRVAEQIVVNNSNIVRVCDNTPRKTVYDTNDEYLVENIMKDKDFYVAKLEELGVGTTIITQPITDIKSSKILNILLKITRMLNKERAEKQLRETIIEFYKI